MAGGIPRPAGIGPVGPSLDRTSSLQTAMAQGAAARDSRVHSKGGTTGVSKLDDAWKTWSQDKSKANMSALMHQIEPVIDKAVTSYAPNSSPSVRTHARILAHQSVANFDPSKGTKLRTYLMIQMQPLRREAASYDTVHMPERVRFDLHVLKQREQEFEEAHGYEPSEAELADFSGISTDRIRHVRGHQKMVVPEARSRPSSEEDIAALPSVHGEPDVWTEAVYSSLSSKDKRIFEMRTGRRTGRPVSVTEIATKMKMTPSAVSQRLKRISNMIAEVEQ